MELGEATKDRLTFRTREDARNPSLVFIQSDPLTLLRDRKIRTAQRLGFILLITTLAFLLLKKTTVEAHLATRLRHLNRFLDRHHTWLNTVACGLWAVTTFFVYFDHAGRITTLAWNALEFIIANNLTDFGRYAYAERSPTAVGRPVLPTFLVLVIDGVTRDPVLTYQIISGLALASFVTSIFWINRLFSGFLLANIGAALAFITPAVTVSLLNHFQSLSHICFLGLSSPTLLLSLIALSAVHCNEPHAIRWLCVAGAGWSLCYLCRAESVLMAGAFFFVALVLLVRQRRPFALLIPAMTFALVFIAHTAWVSAAVAQYDLAHKIIYQFYGSQGWSDPRPSDPQIDVEREGYVYATQLYGAPAENFESLTTAISRNPAAFVRRVENNATRLLNLLVQDNFFSPVLILLFLTLPLAFALLGRLHRLLLTFGVMLFSVAGIFVIFHIDARYIMISVPAAVVVGSLCVLGLDRLPVRIAPNAFSIILLVVLLLRLPAHFSVLSHAFASERLDLSLTRSLGEGFLKVTHPSREERGQIMVQLAIDLPSNLQATDLILMFSYFSRTSNLEGETNDAYPRDRIFSFPKCRPATHALVPDTVGSRQDGTKLGVFSADPLGRFAVYRLSNVGKSCVPLSRTD